VGVVAACCYVSSFSTNNILLVTQANTVDVLDAFNTEAMKLGAMGVTVTVSSGDDGVAADGAYCNFDSSSDTYDMEWMVRQGLRMLFEHS
jgi:ribosomal protein S3